MLGAHLVEIDEGFVREVRARGHDGIVAVVLEVEEGQTLWTNLKLLLVVYLRFVRTHLFATEIYNARHGHIDHAEHGFTIVDKGDIDGKFAVALQKFLCTVQRVNEPVGAHGLALLVGGMAPFFAHHGENGLPSLGGFCQGFGDNFVGALVGDCHR